jgi:outer membrane protein insertion porin family
LNFFLAARKHRCFVPVLRASVVCFVAIAVVCLAPAGQAFAASGQAQKQGPATNSQEAPIIERIEFQGNRRIRSEMLRARIFSRVGDPLNEDGLRRDFHALWNTQYFEDIRLEVQDSPDKPNAKIVIFYVTERPIVRRIEYKGNKSISESDILDRFKERKVGLSVESQFDPTKIKKAEVVLKELLAEHGRQFATVKPVYERVPGTNAVKLTFNIAEGPKVKVGNIIIQGNTAFSSRRIIRSMRHSRPMGIPLSFMGFIPVMSKTFDRPKLDEDLEIGVRGLYQDNGYFKVLVKDPVVQTVEINHGGLPGPWPLIGAKHGKATNITIPIEEGERYHMGTLHVHSADPDKGLSLKQEYLETIFPLKKGELFSVAKIRKAIENYTKLYGNYGFIDFTAVPDTDIHEDTKTIDMTMSFDEQKQFFVRRIEFSGNVGTRDKVIRRELLLSEGDMFRNNLWELSLLRLNQLDYFEPVKAENATIKRNIKQGTVDILLKLKEKGKQSVSLTGGVSGLSGAYVGVGYQTHNFLGLGETLTLSANVGDLERNISFGFTEPYLFDRPLSTGFTIFTSRYNFDQARQTSLALGYQIQLNPNTAQNYVQNSDGLTLFLSYPIRRSFTRVGLTYGLTSTNIKSASVATTALFSILQFQSLAGPSSLSGIHSSRLVPTLTYNSVDNPMNPTHGKSLFTSFAIEGGPVGGNVNSLTDVVEAKYFRPHYHKRNVIAMRFLSSFTTGFGGKVVAPYSRFYLGGETDLRGFDIRTVSPVVFIPTLTSTAIPYSNPFVLDGSGNPTMGSIKVPVLSYQTSFPGGDTEAVVNLEYRIPIASHVSASLYTDIGATGALRHNQLQLNSSNLDALQQTFPNTPISPTLQFQPGTNFKLRSTAGVEVVVQLPIVQAPFRIFWGYNFNRMGQVITAPSTKFPGDPNNPNDPNWAPYKAGIPPQVWDSQVMPAIVNLFNNPQRTNFFDPIRSFRFTVSRTF